MCAGDRQWQDAGFRHPCHRAAPEKRGEAEEDAGGSRDVTARESRASAHAEGVIVCDSVQVGALVITPTRELALQISEVMQCFIEKFPQFT